MGHQLGRLIPGLLTWFCLSSWVRGAEANLLANGGFELAGHLGAKRVEMQTKAGLTFEAPDPLLPLRWRWDAGGAVDLRLAADAHSGKRALQVTNPKGSIEMTMQFIEVVPGVTYSFGGWAKGKGNGRIAVYGNAYEGRKELGNTNLVFTPGWSEGRGKVSIPGNIRSVCVILSVWGGESALVDDLYVSADADQPFDVDGVMTTKYGKDAHTLMFVDFDGQGEYRLESKATLTDDKGGRFGKGVRVSERDVSSVVLPLAVPALPPEGTLEFWFSPDDDPVHTVQYMTLLSTQEDLLWMDTCDTIAARWMSEDGKDYRGMPWRYHWDRGVWIHKGEWHHVALEWDREALRLFVDGVLASYKTEVPASFSKVPSGIKLGGTHPMNAWSGAVDEVRLSDIKRYGPVIPSGAKWTPLVATAQPAAAPAKKTESPPVKPAPDLAKARKALIGTIPPAPAGAITFDATQVKPLLQDDPDFTILTNTPVPGMIVAKAGAPQAELLRMPDWDGAYWLVKGLQPGAYEVGIWFESSVDGLDAPQQYRGRMLAYLNGRALQLATFSDPIQVAPGVWYAEAQSKIAELVKDGDEIAVLAPVWQPVRLARLTLYPAGGMVRGRGWMFENYGASMFARDSALRMTAYCGFRAAPGKGFIRTWMDMRAEGPSCLKTNADGKAVAYYQVANPFAVPLKVACRFEVRGYFREVVGSEDTTLDLKPHERLTREVPFTLLSDSQRYSMAVKAQALNPPSLGWPTADTIDFFPGVRQSVPWPNPFANEFRRSIGFGQPTPGLRQRLSLNGAWKSAFTALPTELPMPPPADLKWEPRQVPFNVSGWNEKPPAHGFYVHRTIALPEDYAQRTWRLLIAEVIDDATVYVNGQKVGRVRGCRTPLLCDITKAVHAGTNELVIAVRDALANMDPAYVNPNNPQVSYQYLDVPGTGYGCAFAIKDVTLLSSPLVTAEDLQVNTSMRRRDITARFRVSNRAPEMQALTVKVAVLDAGRPVLEFGSTAVKLAAGGTQDLTLRAPWKSPVFWGPGTPKLYTLAVELTDPSGRRVDLLRERFGFRESWIENGHIMLNGAPVRLKGSNCGGGGGLVGSDDVQWTRGSDGAEDYLDEFGFLAGYYTLGGLGNTPSRHNIERDSFWEIERQNVLAGAAQYVNHPCLIAWDLSNEWLSFLSYGGGDPLFGARRFKTVGDALLAYDSTRWILFDGDRDLEGLWDVFSEHYSNPYYGGHGMHGHSAYLPDGRFWRPLDREFVPGEPIRASADNTNSVYRPDRQILMNTENSWKVDGLQPPGLSFVVGEDDVLSPAIDSGRGPIVWYWKQNVDGHRDAGFSIVCNYTTVTGLNRRGHMLQCFIMPDHTHHYFSGARFERRYSLHNDLLAPSAYDFRWRLVDAKGKVVLRGHDAHRMDSGDLQRGELRFALPKVKALTRYTLRLDLMADGKFVYGEERDLDVWPATTPAAGATGRRLVVFDPAGQTVAALKQAGIPFEAVNAPVVSEGNAAETVVVLGEGAVRSASDPALSLAGFVEKGGRVVVLAQTNLLPGLPVRTVLEPREWCSQLWLRTPQHPILQGLDSWDLHFWAPDHLVSRGSYSRPDSGSFTILVDGAGDHDRGSRSAMDWTQMLECYRGQGSYLLCQLPLIGKYDAEPMARDLLARIIDYERSGTPFRIPTKTLKVAGDPGAPMIMRLRALDVPLQTVEPAAALDANAVLLVDAATWPSGQTIPAGWKTALGDGATIWVHGASPEQQPLLTALAGEPVTLAAHPYPMWEGRGYRNGFTWLTASLSHIDLYWKTYAGDEGAVHQAEQPKYKLEDLNYWSAKATGAVEHVFPGALVEVPVGRGRLIVDGIRWETANKKLAPLADRIISALMTGLNVAMAPYVPPRNLPSDVVYKPIDLAPFCNRGFRDDVGDDGKGGWADQGPKADLRSFPAGDQNFGGVPFKVGQEPHCCIVLKSNRRPLQDRIPEEVTIPVGYPVEGLWFLHSTSWGGQEPSHIFQIQYMDGTAEEIVVVERENVLGWTSAPSELPRERGTRSRVAWTGTTELFPTICICQMLWVNPKPDAPVKAVRYANPRKELCPILMGLTAAVKPGQADIEARAAGQSKAQDWLRKGIAAAEAGKDAEAREAFQQAVQEDPKLDAAHQRLCELAERGQDENAILAAYKAWTVAGARTPLPYNKIGAILERRGDEQSALEAYTKSLEVEWNQPPIIEAKARLTLKLKR